MQLPLRLVVAALAGLFALPGAAGAAAPQSYIVVYERSVPSPAAETARQERARGFRARFEYGHALKGFAARLSPAQVEALRADPDVAAVVVDRPVHASGALATGEKPPRGVRRIRAATAETASESGAAVAVLDTGIDLDHPDLNAAHGKNCVTAGPAEDDDLQAGHGTHVAGTIGAENDGAGVVGVAPGTTLYAVKVLDATGTGLQSQVICGLDWVVQNADALDLSVANMSLGGGGERPTTSCSAGDPDPERAAICKVVAAGVVPVVAAGNSGRDFGASTRNSGPVVPAVYPEVLTVTAIADADGSPGGQFGSFTCGSDDVEDDDRAATFSNFATQDADIAHTIAAPGVCITSTAPIVPTDPKSGYATLSGTSMAGPHVAGAVARCFAEGGVAGPCAGKTPAQVIDHMRSQGAAAAAAAPSYGFTTRGTGSYGPLVLAGPAPAAETVSTGDPGEEPPATTAADAPASSTETTTPTDAQTETTPIVLDTTAPTATLAVAPRRLGRVLRRGLRVVVSCSEACRSTSRLSVSRRTARRLGLKRRVLARAGSSDLAPQSRLRLRPGASARRRLRAVRRLVVTVRVTTTDAAGNRSAVKRRLTLRR